MGSKIHKNTIYITFLYLVKKKIELFFGITQSQHVVTCETKENSVNVVTPEMQCEFSLSFPFTTEFQFLVSVSLRSMAATLSLLKLPILPCNYNKARDTTRPVPLPPLSAKLNSNSNTPKDFPTPQKFLDHNFNALKNTSLSLTAITFPFLLEPKASNATIYFSFLLIISHAFFSLFFLYSHEINFLWVA